MKIAIINRYFYPFEGGIETFSLNLAKSLRSENNEIYVFTTNFPKNKKKEKKFGITIIRYPFFKLANENFFWFYNDLKKLNPDKIYLNYPAAWNHLLTLAYCLIHKKKMIVYYHAKIVSSLLAKLLGKIYDSLIFFPFAGFYDRLIYAYPGLGPKLKNSEVMKIKINKNLFKPDPKIKKEFDLLYVGRIEKYKRIEWVLNAAKELKLKAAIVGDGPYLSKLKKFKTGATFFGKIENKNVPEFYQKSKIFILPSKSEGMPVTILEAQACNTLVLATNVGGIPEIINKKYLFNTYEEMKEKIKRYL